MSTHLILLIAPPDSSAETVQGVLQGVLQGHPDIADTPPGRILTPLAHLGYYRKVDKAPYDHILAAEAQRLFIQQLPGRGRDYYQACRDYADTLYEGALTSTNAHYCLDTAPEYGRLLPYLEAVEPAARYLIVTRNPIASLSEILSGPVSDKSTLRCAVAAFTEHLDRVAAFLRGNDMSHLVVSYEQLVADPAATLDAIAGFLEIAQDEWGDYEALLAEAQGREDQWPATLAEDRRLARRVCRALDRIAPKDLRTLGFEGREDLWTPVVEAEGRRPMPNPVRAGFHAARRGATRCLACLARYVPGVGAGFRKLRLACDVLLREDAV